MRNVVGRLRRHSWLAAYLALFVALSTGGAYAVDKIGSKEIAKSAVKSRHMKNGGVKNKDLADDAVTAEKVLDGSVNSPDLADDGVKGTDVEEASLGEVSRAARAKSAATADLAQTVADNSITGGKIVDGSLALSDVARSHDFTFGGTVLARRCLQGNANFFALNLQPGDIGFLVPRTHTVPDGIVFGRPSFSVGTHPAATFITGICNITDADIVLPAEFPVRLYVFSP